MVVKLTLKFKIYLFQVPVNMSILYNIIKSIVPLKDEFELILNPVGENFTTQLTLLLTLL